MYRTEHKIGALITALFSLIVYLLTVAPTVTFWDAGEFMAASYCLGIPHAPGTPLFVLFGRVMSVLPLGLTPAFKMNLVSVISGALSSGLIYLIAAWLLERSADDCPARGWLVHGGAFAAGAIFTGLRTVWSNTTEFEVYGVATATILLVGWLMVYVADGGGFQRNRRTLLLVVYIISLSIANHLIVMLAAPAVALFTLLHDRDHRAYWLSVLGLMAGAYLLVVKGIDLTALAGTVHTHTSAAQGLAGNVFAAIHGLLGLVTMPGAHLASAVSAFTGLVLLGVCGWWGWREKSLPFFGAALGLFILGFSVHLYLPLRAALDPAINEGDPDTLRAFWAVIGREQYGSAYGIFPRKVWILLTGKTEMNGVADLVENIKFFFKYNLPFYNQYLGWQFGGRWVTAAFLAAAALGAVNHLRTERKTFWFWLAVLLITGPVLNAYMNFEFGFSQFPEVKLHPSVSHMRLHEPRDRDYFFIVSFAFLALWAAFGLVALARNLIKMISVSGGKQAGRALAGAVCVPVFLTALLPVALNWRHADRSGNQIPRVYARNVLEGLAPDAIVFTNGDNDTFPLWYAQEVEGLRRDIKIVNLSLLNLPWYIRQMRDREPAIALSTPDAVLDSLFPTRSDKPRTVQAGDMKLDFPAGTVFFVKDLMVLDILRSNGWKRPLYFVTSVPEHNQVNLKKHFVLEGLAFRVTEQPAAELAASDSNIVMVYDSTGVNVSRTYELLTEVYSYDTFFRSGSSGETENRSAVQRFAIPANRLELAYESLGEYDKAMEMLKLSSRFYNDPRRYAPTMSMLLGYQGNYDSAAAVMENSGDNIPVREQVQWYHNLAKLAADKADFQNSVNMLDRAIQADSSSRFSYASKFMLLDILKRREQAIELMETYLRHFPADTASATELEKYRQGGVFDINRTFDFGF